MLNLANKSEMVLTDGLCQSQTTEFGRQVLAFGQVGLT